MTSKKFYISILTRIILILINCISIIPFIQKEERLFTILSLFIILIIQIYLLLNYINRFNRELAYFFSALKTNDASYAFHDKAFPYISEKFRNDIEYVKNQIFSITEQKQIQQSYLKTLIENSRTGIISITETGNIDIINRCALDTLNLKTLSSLKSLESIHPGLYHFIYNTRENEKMIVIKGETKAIPLAVRISEFKQKREKFKLITFQNIESELNEKELLSWHKLIRVLTHEINNTISPISSLAYSLEDLFIKENNTISKEEISDTTIKKTADGLQLIAKRGEGLIKFVNNYKSIASLKQMDFEKIKVAELFYNLELFMKNKLNEKDIKLNINVLPIDLEINADKRYIEQIFINLIKNSIDSIQHKSGEILLKGYQVDDNKVMIEITDNGIGISEEIIDQIFIPFFTTKKEGSGIGLSLAQQIMKLHGGAISVQSVPNVKTSFTLKF